jgi:hypothetical protein
MMTDILDPSLIKPGTVVETTFGVGVIISHRGLDETDTSPPMVELRLWRTPGHSIGTSTSAYLHPSAVSTSTSNCTGLFSFSSDLT